MPGNRRAHADGAVLKLDDHQTYCSDEQKDESFCPGICCQNQLPLVILNETKAYQVLVTTGPGLDTIDLGHGRPVYRLQLDIIILDAWRIK